MKLHLSLELSLEAMTEKRQESLKAHVQEHVFFYLASFWQDEQEWKESLEIDLPSHGQSPLVLKDSGDVEHLGKTDPWVMSLRPSVPNIPDLEKERERSYIKERRIPRPQKSDYPLHKCPQTVPCQRKRCLPLPKQPEKRIISAFRHMWVVLWGCYRQICGQCCN